MAPDITLPIVGVDYPNKRGPGRRFELEICRVGEVIELRPEPTNPADEYAIAVYSCRGIQLGYIPSVRAVRVSQLFKQGADIRAIYQGPLGKGGLIRVSFDGNDPCLPPPLPIDPEPDFYPDEEYPDEF